MTILEILNGTSKDIKANFDLLAKDYKEKTGRKVCRSCPSDIQYMILSLKSIYKMTQFKFKRHAAIYKDKPEDKVSISNATMTDEKAIAFLKTRPQRIELFSDYPSNWLDLVNGKAETEKQKEARLAAEAEATAAVEAAENATKDNPEEVQEEDSLEVDAETEAQKEAEKEALKEELLKKSLADLRKLYPEVKATSIKAFVGKVLAEL